VLPKDGTVGLTATDLAVYNYGAPKQIEAVYKLLSMNAYLLLFSAPETYGPSWIVGHWGANSTGAATDKIKADLIGN